MNIIVLGGAGDMGSFAVEALSRQSGVEAVTVADRDVDRARTVAAAVASAPGGTNTRVDAVAVDACDHEALVGVVRGHDLVVSAVGPFHRFEVPCALAAVEAGIDYVSICDEWQAVAGLIDEVDERARAAGVTVLTGMGASPGITNLAAARLAAPMDSVDSIDVYCYEPLDAGGGFAVIEHVLYVMSGTVAVWRDGAKAVVPACSEHRDVEIPGAGSVRLWNMGHPEPLTLPRTFPDARDVRFWMGYGPGSGILVRPARWGWFETPGRRARLAHVAAWLERAKRPDTPGIGALRVDVTGTREGTPAHGSITGTGTMRNATGTALAVGAVMLADGRAKVEGGGVTTPEEAVPTDDFFEELETAGITAIESWNE